MTTGRSPDPRPLPTGGRALLEQLLVLGLGIALFFIQGPRGFVMNLSDHLYDPEDTVGNFWILTWILHAVQHPELSIWDPPIFYPATEALTFTETMFGNLWLALPTAWLTSNLTLCANTVLLASFALSFLGVYLLVRELGADRPAALAAGFLFAFCPYRFAHMPRIQLSAFFFAAFALLYAHRWLRGQGLRPLAFMVLCVLVQFYTSICLGLMLFVLLSLFLLPRAVQAASDRARLGRWFVRRDGLPALVVAGLASAAALWPLAAPYMRTMEKYHFERSMEDNARHAAEPLGFLLPAANVVSYPDSVFTSHDRLYHALVPHLRGGKGFGGGESAVFPGFIPLLLGATGLVLLARRRGPPLVFRRDMRLYLLLCLGMAVLMLGPLLVWLDRTTSVPLPYQLLYHGLPGAKALRAPARFFLPFLLCLAVASGLVLDQLARRIRPWPRPARLAVAACFAALMLLDYRTSDRGGERHDTLHGLPEVYRHLGRSPRGGPVLELPMNPVASLQYLGWHFVHFRPLIGGMGSFTTPEYDRLSGATASCPDLPCLEELRHGPGQTLVVHLDRLPPPDRERWLATPARAAGYARRLVIGQALVWERESR